MVVVDHKPSGASATGKGLDVGHLRLSNTEGEHTVESVLQTQGLETNVVKDTNGFTIGTGIDSQYSNVENVNCQPMFNVMSPGGTRIKVFKNCADGKCNCIYNVANCPLQLKPCRCAAIILSDVNSWARGYLDLLWALTDGFPIVQGDVPKYSCSNYNSILEPESKRQMDVIIKKELAEGIISEAVTEPHCIHALGAVPKPGGKIRPITDCSRPEGLSVNNFCGTLLEDFKFKSVDNVIAILNVGDYMTVIDIKSAYRAVPLLGDHRKYMGFRWELDGQMKTFVDNRMCFGSRLGPSYFARISEFVHDVLVNIHGMRVVNYLDDFIAISSSRDECVRDQGIIVQLLRYLGFHVSFEKVTPPSTCTTYLGIEIDSVSMELRLPERKLVKLKQLLDVHLGKKKISKFDLESLGGLLSHCSHVVRGGKFSVKEYIASTKSC